MANSPHSRRIVALLALGALSIFLTSLRLTAQGSFTRTTDQPGFGTLGRVFGLGVWRNELVAGTVGPVVRDGTTLNHIARFDGVKWYPIGSGLPSRVRTVFDFQGELYAGGLFGVRRFNGSSWVQVGAGLAGEVHALEEFQGQLHACGDFVVSGTTSVRHIARFDGVAWRPLGTGLQSTIPSSVQALDLVTDGRDLYVGGKFEQAGSVPAFGVARWDGNNWHQLGAGTPYIVHALGLHGGRLYVGGLDIALAGGVPVGGLAAWDGTSWSSVGAGVQYQGRGPTIDSIVTYRGELYVAGSFQTSGSTTLHHIARVGNNQLHNVGGVELAEVNPPTIFDTVVWNDRLYCGGEFRVAGDIDDPAATAAVFHIAKYDGQVWSTVGEGLGLDDRGTVLGRYQGAIVVGGAFLTAGGNQATQLARFDGDDWRYFGAFDGVPSGMVEFGNQLWVVGQFQYVDGIWVSGVARFDGTVWHAVGSGLGPSRGDCIAEFRGVIYAGRTGTPVRFNGTDWQSFAPSISGIQTAMHVHQNRLYIANFTAGGSTLFEWDGTNLAVRGTANGEIEAITTHAGALVIGGRFTTVSGLSARSVASFNGTNWSAFGSGPGVNGNTVKTLATFRGELIAGGDFNRGLGGTADYVARWNGGAWVPLAGESLNAAVWSLLPQDDRGELHMCGQFTRLGTGDSKYYGIYHATPHWTEVGTALRSPRRAPLLSGDGSLLPGARVRWRLSSAREQTIGLFIIGGSRIDSPLAGGTLVPSADALVGIATDAIGNWTLEFPWPAAGLGVSMWTQVWAFDVDGPQGFTSSNAVWLRAP